MSKQKIEIEVDVPEGWEATGEYRKAVNGEHYIGWPGNVAQWLADYGSPADVFILRRVEPVKESQYINLYPQVHPAYGVPRSTRASADRDEIAGRVGVVRIDYENGKPVNVALESVEGE